VLINVVEKKSINFLLENSTYRNFRNSLSEQGSVVNVVMKCELPPLSPGSKFYFMKLAKAHRVLQLERK
jgi:hypothetical protein